jgi:hypothetical protein
VNQYFAIVHVGTAEHPGWWWIGSGGQLLDTPFYVEAAQLETYLADFYQRNAVNPDVAQIVVGKKAATTVTTTVAITEC